MKLLRLHPLSHIIICLLLSCLVFALPRVQIILSILLFSMAYAAVRLPSGLLQIFRILRQSLPFVLSIAVLQLIFRRDGELLWSLYWLKISTGGLAWAIILGLRLLTVIYCAKALAVNSFQDFQAAFSALHLPEEFSFMLSYGVQLVPAFGARIKGFVRSLHLRGINPAQLSWKKRILVYKLLAVSALAGIINGSTNSAIALELRGFRSNGKRSSLHKRSFGMADFVLWLAMLLAVWMLLIYR